MGYSHQEIYGPSFFSFTQLISSQTRWIWGNDPLTDLQKTVAPKRCEIPYCGLRCLLLVFSCWISVLIVGFSFVILPVATGRFVFYLCQIPPSFYHEPACFILGMFVVKFLRHLAVALFSISLRLLSLWRFFNFTAMKHGHHLAFHHPSSHHSVGLKIILVWCVMLPLFVGLFYHMLLNYPHDNPNHYLMTLTPFALLRLFLFGAFVTSRLATAILTGQIDRLTLSAGLLPKFENYVFSIGTVWNSLQVLPNGGGGGGNGDGANQVMTSEKLVNDLKTLELLTIHPKIRPYCSYLLITLLLLVSQHLITTAFPFSSFIFSFSWAHAFVYSLLLGACARDLSATVQRWGKYYYSAIQDENYLVGKELQNSEEVSQRPDPVCFLCLT